jgi:hypothetical protein
MRRPTYVLTIVALALAIPTLRGHCLIQVKPEQNKVSELMRRKLENSQKVLEGVTMNDFKLIQRHAEDLIQISKATEWRVIKTPQYEMYSNEFRRIGESLVQSAGGKNLDAAALNYVELTLTCVRCHKYVREIRDASPQPELD